MARLLPVWIDSFPFPGGVSSKDVYLEPGRSRLRSGRSKPT